MKSFSILSVNISDKKGERKKPVTSIRCIENFGIEGDAHAGTGQRQVSLLAWEDVVAFNTKMYNLHYGDFAENITCQSIALSTIPLGTRLYINDVVLEVSHIGKKCHGECDIFRTLGSCIMPHKGIFAAVLQGGIIHVHHSGTYDL